MSKFEVGQRVIRKDSVREYQEYEEDQALRGTIKSIKEDGKVMVNWDSKRMNENSKAISPKELLSEAEGDAKYSELEAEYQVWAGPIREKMEQAAALLSEADALAQAQDRNLTELHEITSPLYQAMRDAGWSTSSLRC